MRESIYLKYFLTVLIIYALQKINAKNFEKKWTANTSAAYKNVALNNTIFSQNRT